MTKRITVRGQFPRRASFTFEPSTQIETVSTHGDTRRGHLNAARSLRRASANYYRSNGNAAAHQVWIETPDGQKWNWRTVEIFADHPWESWAGMDSAAEKMRRD